MAAERKLINEQDASTFEKAFSNAARLPTEEDRRRAMEKGFRDVIREDLHRDSAYQPNTQRDTRRPAGTNGWLAEQPISAPPGISLIDAMLPAENERRAEARKLLERLLRSAPNDPRVLAAQEALRAEQEDGVA
jgi:hypothetical protein